MKKCSICKTKNAECKVVKATPTNMFSKIINFGSVKITICQSCISRLMRGLDPKI